jgi:hypothetical protein
MSLLQKKILIGSISANEAGSLLKILLSTVLPPERTSSVCFQASLTKSFCFCLISLRVSWSLQFHVMWMICASLEAIKAANVSSIKLDNLSRAGGGLYFVLANLRSCSVLFDGDRDPASDNPQRLTSISIVSSRLGLKDHLERTKASGYQ